MSANLSDLSLRSMFDLGSGVAGLLASRSSVTPQDYASHMTQPLNPYTLQQPVESTLLAQQQKNIVNEGLMQEQQAQQVLADAYQNVAQKSREAMEFRESQAAKYTNNGVLLEGSPMLVLNRTIDLTNQEIAAMANRAAAEANLLHLRNVNQQNEAQTRVLAQQAGYNMDTGMFDANAMMARQSEVGQRIRRTPGLIASLGTLLPAYLGWRRTPTYTPPVPQTPQPTPVQPNTWRPYYTPGTNDPWIAKP